MGLKNKYKIQEDYIHFHHGGNYDQKIGDKVAKSYFLQKSQALLRYKQGFQYSLLNNNSVDSLNEIIALNNGNDDQVYGELNQILAENVQSAIDRSDQKISTMGDDFATIRNQYKQMFSNRRADLQQLQSFLNDSAQLFNQLNLDGSLIAMLATELQNKKYNARQFAQYIQEFLSRNNHQTFKVNENKAYNFLSTLASRIEEKATGAKGGRVSYSAKKMSQLIIDLFNAGVGEYKIAEIIASMKDDNIDDIIDNFLTGKDTRMSITKTGETRKVAIKPDVIVDGLKVVYSKNSAIFNFNMQASASVKTYSSQSANNFGFHIGTRYLLQDILNTMNLMQQKKRYWVVNALSHSESAQNYYYAGVVKQHIDLLISGTQVRTTKGNSDFANLFIANGKVYSIYDIIKRITSNRNPISVLNTVNVNIRGGKIGRGNWKGNEPNWDNAKDRSRELQLRYDELKYSANFTPERIF